jgi:hypothetical protein
MDHHHLLVVSSLSPNIWFPAGNGSPAGSVPSWERSVPGWERRAGPFLGRNGGGLGSSGAGGGGVGRWHGSTAFAGGASYRAAVWRAGDGRVVLEPGEVEALAEAARLAALRAPAWHPRRRMLVAVAAALAGLEEASGVVVAPAPASLVRRAARAQVRVRRVAARRPA